ncbi:MAG: hypothetical protein QOG84_54 [Sphingomonadales bacterium]|jgi:hypothetical protein|nr:hypothetical protein [Sphingomonadales bacterium]
MNRIIIALAATTAFSAATPAAAQYGGNFQLRTGELQAQLQAGIDSGAIGRREAMPLNRQLRDLTQLERLYSRGGFTVRERSDLQSRSASLRQAIGMAERDVDRRYGRVGDSGRVYARGELMDRNRDGYDDRDLNRDRRVDDGEWRTAAAYDARYGRSDERYQETRRDGIGGVVDTLLGRDTLRVGQRVSANLGGVPDQYRDQYRDGSGVYYRSDNRAIYQVDARNDVVLRVFALTR